MASVSLPALPAPTRFQLALWSGAIGAAAALILAAGVRLATAVDLLQWWVPLAWIAGMAAADFGSGLVHWGADTWGRATLPVVGPRFLVPFRVHHLNPDDFLRRRFLDANGDTAALTIPALLALVLMPLDTLGLRMLAVASLACCTLGALTNQVHQWAHMTRPPRAVRGLQALGLLLRPTDHAAHHADVFDASYCITTGWCNRPLEALDFFRRLERVVTWLTGLEPREDERDVHRSSPGNERRAHARA
jgi:ubiquitin-conjugating enzyme E2 variant